MEEAPKKVTATGGGDADGLSATDPQRTADYLRSFMDDKQPV